jgi:cytochrome c oxidase assembly protein subunit 15
MAMSASHLLLLAAIALAVAVLPLAWVLRAPREARYRRLAWLTVFLTVDLIVFGAFTRLTDSGLGCPDWPGCYGHSNPLSAGEFIRAAETALPTGPVTMAKAWIEMLHRYFAMGVGLLICVLAAAAWLRWRRDSRRSPWLAFAALVAVCVQGAFGALTVTMKLQPAIVTTHLLGAMLVLSLLCWLALREEPALPADAVVARASLPRLFAAAGLAVLVLQIALGGWVSTNYAVMACPDFPLCHGRLVPDMDFAHGFALWRDLGMTARGDPVPFAALVAIHWVHRNAAYGVALVLGLLAWRLRPVPLIGRLPAYLGLGLGVQILTGMSNVVLQWPLALALAHNLGAAVLVVLLVRANHHLARLAAASQPRQAAQGKMAVSPDAA